MSSSVKFQNDISETDEKVCVDCGESKPLSEFHGYMTKNKGYYYRPNCKRCSNARQRELLQRNKSLRPHEKRRAKRRPALNKDHGIPRYDSYGSSLEELVNSLDLVSERIYRAHLYILNYKEARDCRCVCCGEKFPAELLEFHHVDPSTKEYEIGNMVSKGYDIDLISIEVAKCVLINPEHHRLYHSGKMTPSMLAKLTLSLKGR